MDPSSQTPLKPTNNHANEREDCQVEGLAKPSHLGSYLTSTRFMITHTVPYDYALPYSTLGLPTYLTTLQWH